jgi:hypothetical protein
MVIRVSPAWKKHNPARMQKAVNIYRIAANPLFRDRGFMKQIIAWSKGHARALEKFYPDGYLG